MSIFAYDPFWHSSNFLLYVVSVPNGSEIGVDIACSGSRGTLYSVVILFSFSKSSHMHYDAIYARCPLNCYSQFRL